MTLGTRQTTKESYKTVFRLEVLMSKVTRQLSSLGGLPATVDHPHRF